MTKHQTEMITSVERRRRWAGKRRSVWSARHIEMGANVSELGRSAGIQGSMTDTLIAWVAAATERTGLRLPR